MFWELEQWHWCSSASCVIGWADHWQTMITGVLAVGAAVAAARLAAGQLKAAHGQIDVGRQQIEAAKQEALRARAAKLRAARSSLPATLSAVCDYAEGVARTLDAAWPQAAALYPGDVPEAQAFRITVRIAEFPATLIPPLERLVELTEVEEVADRVESLLREIQVLGARGRGLHEGELLTLRDFSGYILEAASIYARAESLLGYGRRLLNTVSEEPLWDRVLAALNLCGVTREEVRALAQEERAHGLPPGEADIVPS